MEFVSALPDGGVNKYVQWDESLANDLRLKPGVWAIVKDHCNSKAAARSQAYMVSTGRKRHLPPTEFEAAVRYDDDHGWSIYVRAIPKTKQRRSK